MQVQNKERKKNAIFEETINEHQPYGKLTKANKMWGQVRTKMFMNQPDFYVPIVCQ